ncbi:MAG: BolA family protein [Pseudomonadales bacterium]
MEVETTITNKLSSAFAPVHMEVINESHMHSVPANSETHFKVIMVSTSFDGKRKVARHQQVYKELAPELEGPVHALSMFLYTPAEWSVTDDAPDSPECMGGSKAES